MVKAPTSQSFYTAANRTSQYTTYQPPATREQQQRELEASNLQHDVSLGDMHLSEPDSVSSDASTVVGAPETPCSESWFPGIQHRRCISLSPLYPSDMDHCQPSRGLSGPRSATTTGSLEYSDQRQSLAMCTHNSSVREPHISVMMEEILLENVTEAPSSNMAHCHSELDNYCGAGEGASTPRGAIGGSSTASSVDLSAQNTKPLNSSSSTLFGTNSNTTLHNPAEELRQEEAPEQHQSISMNSDGKMYSIRPKSRQFGKKKAKGQGKGNRGNNDRMALFSNERTFINWIKLGILLGSMALTLCNFGPVRSLGFYIGVSILVVAMSSLAYAAAIFHRRDRSLSRRLAVKLAKKQAKHNRTCGAVAAEAEGNAVVEPRKARDSVDSAMMSPREVRYYDRAGPTALCSVLLLAYSVNFYCKV
ncbi:hypothetical protein BGZ54_002169 [Gamsiella multidivaricata]|nr:hypothetical protein BGZ54_002169 [Gamsiella multidivaricata]